MQLLTDPPATFTPPFNMIAASTLIEAFRSAISLAGERTKPESVVMEVVGLHAPKHCPDHYLRQIGLLY